MLASVIVMISTFPDTVHQCFCQLANFLALLSLFTQMIPQTHLYSFDQVKNDKAIIIFLLKGLLFSSMSQTG